MSSTKNPTSFSSGSVNELKEITNKEILKEIKKYSPHSERMTLNTLLLINLNKHICNEGESGIGKSWNTEDLVNLMKMPHRLISGHISPKAFYEVLQQDGIIIIDEGALVLSNIAIQNLLLNALWNGKVEWTNNKEVLTHDFKGCICFNTNSLNNNATMKAVADRLFVTKIKLNSNQIKEKIMSSKNYKPNMKIWAEIKERIQENKKTELSEKISNKIYALMEHGEPKSVRDIAKLKDVARFSLNLMGDLSLIDYFIDTDEVWTIMNMDIKRSEKVKKIAELKCMTDRGARRIAEKFE